MATASPGPAFVVGIGTSAGGVEALVRLAKELPPGYPGAIVVVLHVADTGRSILAEILARSGPLPAIAPDLREPLLAGRIHVAAPGRHLLVDRGYVTPVAGPRENGHRPAVDPMLRTLAEAYGPRAVGVILSGNRDDGTAGLQRIKHHGGWAIVQDPEEALYDGMPRSALAQVDVDEVLTLDEIARRLVELSVSMDGKPRPDPLPERAPADEPSTRYTCPECGGVLHTHRDGTVDQLRCSVGHAYSLDTYVDVQRRDVEQALWGATRMLSDRAALMRDMARRASQAGRERGARLHSENAEEAERQAEAIRSLINDRVAEPVEEAHHGQT
jgi:two-component system chemotaxis response regulator CheB